MILHPIDLVQVNGGKIRCPKAIYTIHVTTPNRQTFCMDIDDGSWLSHLTSYIIEALECVCTLWTRMLLQCWCHLKQWIRWLKKLVHGSSLERHLIIQEIPGRHGNCFARSTLISSIPKMFAIFWTMLSSPSVHFQNLKKLSRLSSAWFINCCPYYVCYCNLGHQTCTKYYWVHEQVKLHHRAFQLSA